MQICGEGLLLEALLDARRVHPSQPLSIVYHVESLLARMRECGGHFTVAFFSSYAALWQLVYDDGSAGSARAVLQAHLSNIQGTCSTDGITRLLLMSCLYGTCFLSCCYEPGMLRTTHKLHASPLLALRCECRDL